MRFTGTRAGIFGECSGAWRDRHYDGSGSTRGEVGGPELRVDEDGVRELACQPVLLFLAGPLFLVAAAQQAGFLAVELFLVPRCRLLPEVEQAVARGRERDAQLADVPFAAREVGGDVAGIRAEGLRVEVERPVP